MFSASIIKTKGREFHHGLSVDTNKKAVES
jgi:hypothetical protein